MLLVSFAFMDGLFVLFLDSQGDVVLSHLVHGLGLILLRSGGLLNVSVVKQPLCEKVNWVLRVGLVQNCHSFGYNETDLVALEVLRGRG